VRAPNALRGRLLDAYAAVRVDMEQGFARVGLPANGSTPAGAGNPALTNSAGMLLLGNPAIQTAALPPARKVHPYLLSLLNVHGATGKAVSWAIQQMTDDYTLSDIAALLKREGWDMPSVQISVVLTRLKARGQIKEIKRGGGRTPAVFRKPANPVVDETKTAEPGEDTQKATQSGAVE
jgi:hypothetical protein